ncbi:MAG: hypothetical protein V1888_02865 [archaeon]
MEQFDDNLNYLKRNSNLIGRDEETKELLYRIASGNMLLIEGDKGAGKTAMLRHAIDNFKGKGKVAYVDIGTFGKRFDVEKVLNKKLKGMILLVDNVQYLSESNNKKIKYYYDQDYIRSVVFTTTDFGSVNFTDAIKSRIGRNILKLKKLKKSEVLEIVNRRLGSSSEAFPREILDKLLKDSKSLKELLSKCNSLVEYLEKEDKEKLKLGDLDYMVTYLDEDKVNNCLECNKKLVGVGKYWRCKSCDKFCGTCGVLYDDGDSECPGCGSKVMEDGKCRS